MYFYTVIIWHFTKSKAKTTVGHVHSPQHARLLSFNNEEKHEDGMKQVISALWKHQSLVSIFKTLHLLRLGWTVYKTPLVSCRCDLDRRADNEGGLCWYDGCRRGSHWTCLLERNILLIPESQGYKHLMQPCLSQPGLSGACIKCWDVKVFPSGYLGCGGSLESRYVHSKCIKIYNSADNRDVGFLQNRWTITT